MNILLCGARGFIGHHIAQALRAQGHRVIAGHSSPVTSEQAVDACTMDFSHDHTTDHWLPRLAGVDAVINAVGLLRPTRHHSLQAVHTEAPCALMDACAVAGTPRLIHISALGIEGSPTDYARTKLAADAHAMAMHAAGKLSVTVLRPSIVFGRGGASSAMFTALAHSPLLCLPRPVLRARVQPVAVQDLADAVARLVLPKPALPAMVCAVGPQALTLADFIGSLRTQLGHTPARILPLPDTLTRWSARLGDHIPGLPWCSATLSLLAQDNTADAAAFARILGRDAQPHDILLKGAALWRPRHA